MRTVTEWPNQLGFDVEDAEIWKHKDCFRVFTTELAMKIPYEITTDPLTALEICERQGYRIADYASMDARDAQQMFDERLPIQKPIAFPFYPR